MFAVWVCVYVRDIVDSLILQLKKKKSQIFFNHLLNGKQLRVNDFPSAGGNMC